MVNSRLESVITQNKCAQNYGHYRTHGLNTRIDAMSCARKNATLEHMDFSEIGKKRLRVFTIIINFNIILLFGNMIA